ncbi:MAG: ribosome silencing factor [Coriobacteriia bacterium]|nr:ribosome silencing factor [Coriobacteriia bacterium]MBS5478056.1 ribosome silencing factor [Coriobacteriia bacterium]
MYVEPLELVSNICRIIDEKQGSDVVVQDLRGLSDITEYFVIASAANNRLVDAIADEIENSLRPLGERAFAIEGREECTWVLMDFGSVLVHLFQPEARAFYRLERLWGDAPRATVVDGELGAFEGEAPKARVGVGTDSAGTKVHADD